MKDIYLKALSIHLPVKILTNEELTQEFPEWTVEKIATKVGINSRHIAGKNETAGDLAEKAALNLFKNWDIKPEDVDFLLFCTQSPDYFLPTTACTLQHKLNIPITSGALDYNLGCSGFIYGLLIAKGLIISGGAKNVLILTSETLSKHLHPKDKGNRTILADGASATLISDEGFAKIGEFNLGTDGKGAENLMIKTGGMKHKSPLNEESVDGNGAPKYSDYLYMNGSEIFSFAQEKVPIVVNETLSKNQLQKSDIDLFIFHQANKFMLDFLRKKIKIEKDKFYICIENVGNTSSSSIPIALDKALKENKIKNGDKVLITGFGVGYSWGGTILTF